MSSKQPIVFDIDGTLTTERYNQFNVKTVTPHKSRVLAALQHQSERPLIISTARSESLRGDTEYWLAEQGLKPVEVYMGPDPSLSGLDYIVKYQHLLNIRKKYGDPWVWVDDNGENVRMLQENGVLVIHAPSTY